MCRLIETINIRNGAALNIDLHSERMNLARRRLFGIDKPLDLSSRIVPPAEAIGARMKCRVIYSKTIESIEYSVYHRKEVRSLQLVEANNLDYSFKYLDRSAIEELYGRRGECDDVLFVKNGLLTDTSICNIALFDGKEWHTPAEPLLCGVQREALLRAGIIKPARITVDNIKNYSLIKLFNALNDWDECNQLGVENIHV